jgi:transposase
MEISAQMNDRERELKIAMSMPGIGKISAMTFLAEIGNY